VRKNGEETELDRWKERKIEKHIGGKPRETKQTSFNRLVVLNILGSADNYNFK